LTDFQHHLDTHLNDVIFIKGVNQMSIVKKIPVSELMDFVLISSNAYPSFGANSKEEKENKLTEFTKIQNELPNENFYGLYRNEKLLGGMLLHDFKMNFHSNTLNVGGLGSVAVEFLHKKEKVAKELVSAYLKHYQENDVNLAVLYPFRPDFYMNMGFGYGTKMNQYRLKPDSFYKSSLRKNIHFLNEEDKDEIISCYNQFASQHHGMIEMATYESENMFKNPKLKIIGYKNDGVLEGVAFFSFKSDKDNFLINDMILHKLVYNSRDALQGIFGFLNSQSDQIRYVIIHTQDESIYHMLSNPVNGSNHVIPHVYHETNVQGVGIMYRVIDVKNFFRDLKSHNFNHANCLLKLAVHDQFLEENNESFCIHFIDGYANIVEDTKCDVEISMNIAEFSSLIMGVVSFKSLYQYSLADITDISYLEMINQIFSTNEKPICMTGF